MASTHSSITQTHTSARPNRLIAASFALALLCADSAYAQLQGQAVAGRPFGVAQVTFYPDPTLSDGNLAVDQIVLDEPDNRVLYPAVAAAPLRRAIRQLLDSRAPRPITVYFLFTGEQPLAVSLPTSNQPPVELRVVRDERLHYRMLQRWWREYRNHARRVRNDDEYPSIVEDYLVDMLSRRLDLRIPLAQQRAMASSALDEGLGLMLGSEALRTALEQPRLANSAGGGAAASLDVPGQSLTNEFEEIAVPGVEVAIEPIALHVPAECAYIRFGNFSNFLWLREFVDQWGGNLQNMIAVRGLDQQMNHRIEQQLALRQSALSKVLGPTVIADVAILLGDVAVEEGAATGVLFQAKNNLLLSTDFKRQRAEALSARQDATETTVTITDRRVSFLSTADNQVRSFYAVDGDFHLVTNSRRIVRRFFEAGNGDHALGSLSGFRSARTASPPSDNDLVFAFLSKPFFQQLVSPEYVVEARRRRRAALALQHLQMARWAARAEGSTDASVDDLRTAGYLPASFDRRVDGSRVVEQGDQLLDSLRGARGTFVPIGDVSVEKVTPAENDALSRTVEQFRREWEEKPSVTVSVKKQALSAQRLERIVANVRVTPVPSQRFRMVLNALGPPTTRQTAPVEGDMASLQAVFMVGLPIGGGDVRPHHIFGGLRDFTMPIVVRSGSVDPPTRRHEFIRGYLGAWPKIGLLELFVRPSTVVPDADGYAPLPSEVGWQRQLDPMTVFSFKRDVLAEVTPQLRIEDAERPAQIRLRVADLTDSQLALAVNAFGYQRARDTSIGGARFMNTLAQQLHVPTAECRSAGEQLLNARFVCALGGDYEQDNRPGRGSLWTSNAISPQNRTILTEVPGDYQFPLLEWFRGLDAELSVTPGELAVRTQIDIQQKSTPPEPAGFKLPSLPGFGE